MFTHGAYAGGWPSAGMLGYVQSESFPIWLRRLASGLADRRVELRVCEESPDWVLAGWEGSELGAVNASQHERIPQSLGKLQIFHMLLNFT
jgi:hypothetical protein